MDVTLMMIKDGEDITNEGLDVEKVARAILRGATKAEILAMPEVSRWDNGLKEYIEVAMD